MDIERERVSHRIDMTSLVILYFSTLACLIRCDFNYAVIFFCYFAWQNRKDRISLNLIAACTVLLLIYDIIFAFLEARVWMKLDDTSPVWNRLAGLHTFTIVCSVVIFMLKLILLYYVYRAKQIDQKSLI